MSMVLQDMLQAALYTETDFELYSVATSLDTTSTVNSETHVKSKNVEQLCGGNDSVAVSKTSNSRMRCTDSFTPVSGTGVTNVPVDVAAVFHLSQDEFSDDIDDLSYTDLPLHSELPHGSESSSVTANCLRDVNTAVNTESSSSLVSDVISEDRSLQLPKNSLTERRDVNDMLHAVGSAKRKRKFPGPAGILPKLVRNDMMNISHNEYM